MNAFERFVITHKLPYVRSGIQIQESRLKSQFLNLRGITYQKTHEIILVIPLNSL